MAAPRAATGFPPAAARPGPCPPQRVQTKIAPALWAESSSLVGSVRSTLWAVAHQSLFSIVYLMRSILPRNDLMSIDGLKPNRYRPHSSAWESAQYKARPHREERTGTRDIQERHTMSVIRGVLLAGGSRTHVQLCAMTADDQRKHPSSSQMNPLQQPVHRPFSVSR